MATARELNLEKGDEVSLGWAYSVRVVESCVEFNGEKFVRVIAIDKRDFFMEKGLIIYLIVLIISEKM